MKTVSGQNTNKIGVAAEKPAQGRLVNATTKLIVGAVAAFLAMGLFVWLADEVMEQATQSFDVRILHFLHSHRSPGLYQFLAAISQIGSPTGHTIAITCAVLYLIWRNRFLFEGLMLILGGIGGGWLNDYLKQLFHRSRPEPAFYHLGYSFPSGHAMSAMIVYGMLAYVMARELRGWPRLFAWSAAAAMILLVGFSRMYLGVHYPSDVLGGYLAGVCWLWGCFMCLHVLEQRRQWRANKRIQPNESLE